MKTIFKMNLSGSKLSSDQGQEAPGIFFLILNEIFQMKFFFTTILKKDIFFILKICFYFTIIFQALANTKERRLSLGKANL